MNQLASYWTPEALIANGIILLHLLGASCIGGILGYERSFHGRAAGLRTYAVVCSASALLTVVCAFPQHWFGGFSTSTTGDPTRVIQGIVTGIGFVGAGVIMKEGFTIRGLSTAASIWMTAAIGVAIGLGFFAASIAAAVLTLIIMASFRRIESILPHQQILHLNLGFHRQNAQTSKEVCDFLASFGFLVTDLACQISDDGALLEYVLILRSKGSGRFDVLADNLAKTQEVVSFHLMPSRD
jgi:putative Mg2+ transporter-C (MgtC) family protein